MAALHRDEAQDQAPVTRRTAESGSTLSSAATGRHGNDGTYAFAGSRSMALVNASTPVSRSAVNRPRRPALSSVAMYPGRIVVTAIRLPRTSERMPSASALRAALLAP